MRYVAFYSDEFAYFIVTSRVWILCATADLTFYASIRTTAYYILLFTQTMPIPVVMQCKA
jgi:hypothetical protein